MAGYVEDGSNDPKVDWVTPFEQETGCEVTSKMYGTSDEAFNLAKSGDYDVIAASGDPRCALIASARPSPVNTDLIHNYDDVFDFLKDKEWNTVDGMNYGVPHGYGANLLMYNADEVDPAPTSWTAVFERDGEVQGQGHGVRLADLHRRRRAVPDEAPARPRDQEPLRARRGAARRRDRPAQAAARVRR